MKAKSFTMHDFNCTCLDATDKLENRVKVFFAGARKQKTLERDTEFESIRSEYYKVLKDAGIYN